MAKYAAIDAGTNSTKMTVAEVGADGVPLIVATDFEPTRVGLSMQGSKISAAAIEQTVAALCRFVASAHQHQVRAIRAVATQFAREASNFGDLQGAVREQCGLELEVISGDEEARLAYRAIGIDFPASEAARFVFNIGGGSTEVIYGHAKAERVVSVPIGASSITKRYPAAATRLTAAQLQEIEQYVEKEINKGVSFMADARGATLIASGGTMTNLGAVDNARQWGDSSKVHLYLLPASHLRDIVEHLAEMGEAERVKVPGLAPDRASIIVGGALIALKVAALVGAEELVISGRGLRDGLLAEMGSEV
jgi:exopolyphosphatase/guanosine-5'-triphosphate,3'-diphosphate pyrophosphatase